MTPYLRSGLHILLWSLLITVAYDHFILSQNPFLGLVFSVVLLTAILIQLILLRKRGLTYIGIFLTGLIAVTTVLMYIDDQLFSGTTPRRYYGIVKQAD